MAGKKDSIRCQRLVSKFDAKRDQAGDVAVEPEQVVVGYASPVMGRVEPMLP